MEETYVNVLDRDLFAREVPHAMFKYLRDNDPIHLHPETNGPGFYVISRYEDLRTVTADPGTYSSSHKLGNLVALEEEEHISRQVPEFAGGEFRMLNTIDPPEHITYRKMVSAPFTPKALRNVESHVRNICTSLLDEMIARGSCDWVEDVAAQLPITVICEFLGVPREDHAQMLLWSNQIVAGEDPEFATAPDISAKAMFELFEFSQKLAEERRAHPTDDIISSLVNDQVDSGNMTMMEFKQLMVTLLAAGNETTRYTLAAGISALLDEPEQYAALVADPSLIPGAVEEMLRWATPVVYFRRTTTCDTVLSGVPISKGSKVAIYFISANFDERVFENPYKFDIYRKPNVHVAFGAPGPHFCLGASLSRMQIKIMLEELVKRVPVLVRAGPDERVRSIFVNGIKHLPLDLTGARPQAAAA